MRGAYLFSYTAYAGRCRYPAVGHSTATVTRHIWGMRNNKTGGRQIAGKPQNITSTDKRCQLTFRKFVSLCKNTCSIPKNWLNLWN